MRGPGDSMSVHKDWFVQSFVVRNCLTRGASKEVLAGIEIPGSRVRRGQLFPTLHRPKTGVM